MLAACSSGSATPGPVTAPTTTAPAPSAATAPPAGVPNPASRAWTAPVHGAVYAQPVVSGNQVFVATEADEVYALSLSTGRIEWLVSIGTPLTQVVSHAGCGDIDPLGITSTPVVDAASSTLYVVGEVSHGGAPPVRRERAGLALDGSRVVVGFGGQDGDCGSYHGWVVGVSTTAGVANVQFDTTPGGSGGAAWQGGAPPSVSAAGDVYVVTGNQNAHGAAGYYESVVKLSPTLRPLASLRDRAAVGDEDFGTSDPLLLPGGGSLWWARPTSGTCSTSPASASGRGSPASAVATPTAGWTSTRPPTRCTCGAAAAASRRWTSPPTGLAGRRGR